jgi:glycosyltransferase involved in cell wall biosynthesis
MKLLFVSGSPLEKFGSDYFAVDSWIRIPQSASSQCEKVTLWSPVLEHISGDHQLEHTWRVELGRLRVEPHDYYNSFLGHYRRWFRQAGAWRRHADQIIAEHDVVVIRHPSPMISIVTNSALRLGKPLVVMIMSDLSRTDRVVGNRGLKRWFYATLAKVLVFEEVKSAKSADIVYVYSSILARRHRHSKGLVKMMKDPHLRKGDLVYREDTCISAEIRLLRVSWIQPLKGLEYLLEMVAILVTIGINVVLEIVGQERSLGYQTELEHLAENLGISDRVTFTGWVPYDQMQHVYLRNDIQVISSLTEGAPRCVYEGAARGLPLVSTTAGGLADILTHEVDSLLVPPMSAEALAYAVERVVRDGVLRRKMIQQGYQMANDATFEELGVKFIDEIERIFSAKRK